VAQRVYLHIGLPKTATTYLQRILWAHEDQMRAEGLLLPGGTRRAHLWASRTVRRGWVDNDNGVSQAQRTAWDRMLLEMADWPGRALVSHEFFAAASTEQAQRVVEQLAPAEVHVVVTAREPLGLFAASWQEALKNGETTPMSDYGRDESEDPRDIWNWRTLDLRLVLQRWAPAGGPVAPAHVHVLALPGKEAPREQMWHHFAGLLGLDPDGYDLSSAFANESMGVVEAETLRRVNEHLGGFTKAIDKGTYIRTFLGDERLVPRGGERYWPGEDQVDDCRRRGREGVAFVREQGYDVVGELDSLLVPDTLPERRRPDSVTDAEVARVAVELVATMLGDVRDLRHERRRLQAELDVVPLPAPLLKRLRDRTHRVLTRRTE
jgi:hypothetical protein